MEIQSFEIAAHTSLTLEYCWVSKLRSHTIHLGTQIGDARENPSHKGDLVADSMHLTVEGVGIQSMIASGNRPGG